MRRGREAAGGAGAPVDLWEELGPFVAAVRAGGDARARAMGLFRSALTADDQDRLVRMVAAGLDSREPGRRKAAAEALAAIGLPALGVVGTRAVNGKRPVDRLRAVWVLGELSAAHRVPPGYALAVALKDRAAHVRRAAEEALRSIRQAGLAAGEPARVRPARPIE